MKKYRCLIVDDESLARELIETHLSQLQEFELVASCASAIEAIPMLQDNSIDLMFLDIELPVLKGTDFYKNLIKKPKVIFTTAYRDYALEGFELDAVDYLLKPIVFSRFFNAIEKFKALEGIAVSPDPVHNEVAKDHLFVREDRKQVKIWLHEIYYIKGLKDYVEIHLKDKKHIVKSSLTAFHESLGTDFIRVHRSYVVNIKHISAYTNKDIELGSIEIPIGDSFKEQLQTQLKRN